jgi:ABC-2 type transport system permease protein
VYGNILLVFFILFLGVFSFVGLGILITSFSDKEETAMMMMTTIMFPMMFLGGVFFPIEQMPGFMQTISQFLPLTYATSALRKVMVLGAGLDSIMAEILFMVAFGVVFLTIAVPLFKRAMNR